MINTALRLVMSQMTIAIRIRLHVSKLDYKNVNTDSLLQCDTNLILRMLNCSLCIGKATREAIASHSRGHFEASGNRTL